MSRSDDRAMWDGPVKVVDALDLEAATMEGWTLLQVIRVDRVEYVSSDVVNHGRKESYEGATLSLGASAVAQDVTFLVGKTEETALAESMDALKLERTGRGDAESKAKELQEAFDGLKGREASLVHDLGSYKDQWSDERTRANEERARRRKLENDMTKVIARIGQREWDAAVETSEGETA